MRIAGLEGNEFYNQIQDKEQFKDFLYETFNIKKITSISENLIAGVDKLNIYLELEK